ncbi:MAG: chorismate synthase [Candidatus Omnitrophica bacterium]|nr:chorismate synthase [Candidatus Omnitrophota bacterium]
MRWLTAGESHGECMLALIEGLPAGLAVDADFINQELSRRQQGYGRGARMGIEKDTARILSGIKNNRTLGSPVALLVPNRDCSIDDLPGFTAPRPGHADLAGMHKYDFEDGRCVLERASARETVARVAAGALCKLFLRELGITLRSRTVSVGGCTNRAAQRKRIDRARKKGDTLGGIFEVIAEHLPVGLGSYVQYDRRLDARLAAALVSIPAVKGVEFGLGFAAADRYGSQAHDRIYYQEGRGYYRRTNNAGGLEGGMTNGQPLVCRCAMKPIATLQKPLPTVDVKSKKTVPASVQRSDIAAVEAAAVVGEAMAATVLTDACLERFGQDNLKMIKKTFRQA